MKSMTTIAIVLGSAVSAFAQAPEYAKQEVSVQALGSFVKSTTSNGVQQSATNSGGVLASYRYFFNNKNGAEVNYAWTSDTEKYTGIGIKSNINEASAAYVFRLPQKHFTPFVLAGAGGLIFTGNTQARAAFVYGGGADFNLSPKIFVRAEYRGLVYNSPTFDLNLQDRATHRAEPSIGIGYRF